MTNKRALVAFSLLSGLSLASLAPACGGANGQSGFNADGGGNASSNGAGNSDGSSNNNPPNLGTGSSSGGANGSSGSMSSGGGVVCPSNLKCNVACTGNATTSITGIVMDPAGANPLYNVVAYVPSTTVGALPSGVLTGADKCSCSALFQGDPIVYATTNTSGVFTINNAPVGTDMPLVIQIGKWRIQTKVTTTTCAQANAGTIKLPANSTQGDLPDIAVSTGGADSLECLLRRIGVDASEYVAGPGAGGHIHIFNGGSGKITDPNDPSGGPGKEEENEMSGAPSSYASGGLWDSVDDLMKNDIVLLSCEGGETYSGKPPNLEEYLNAGGRAFASHYHYAWFTGSLVNSPVYTAPTDWGNNLADWSLGAGASETVGGEVQTKLTSGGGSFAKGVALETWMGSALTKNIDGTTVATPEVPIVEPRYNASVTNQAPSQSWIQLDTSTDPDGISAPTLYFSFDTPIGGNGGAADGGAEYCGRAVFSGLHVGGASYDSVNCIAGEDAGTHHGSSGGGSSGGTGAQQQGCNPGHIAIAPPPAGCDTTHGLSPQEKVLEFMLFDLSSCVIPDTIAPSDDAGTPVIPQ